MRTNVDACAPGKAVEYATASARRGRTRANVDARTRVNVDAHAPGEAVEHATASATRQGARTWRPARLARRCNTRATRARAPGEAVEYASDARAWRGASPGNRASIGAWPIEGPGGTKTRCEGRGPPDPGRGLAWGTLFQRSGNPLWSGDRVDQSNPVGSPSTRSRPSEPGRRRLWGGKKIQVL